MITLQKQTAVQKAVPSPSEFVLSAIVETAHSGYDYISIYHGQSGLINVKWKS